MVKAFAFSRNERLRGRKIFAELFATGKSFSQYPYRVTWKVSPESLKGSEPLQVSFVVPKRNFKKASQRNLIRRRMKEAFRLNKTEFSEKVRKAGLTIVFVCIYSGKEESLYPEIESEIIVTLHRLAQEISKANPGLATQ
jgi:ribonuclease P protein component